MRTTGLEIEQRAADSQITAALEGLDSADVVIVGTISADHDSSPARLVYELILRGKHPIVIAMRTPYDLTAFESVDTYLCTYGIRRVSMEAAARILIGEVETRGVLPCAMSGTTTRYPA
jgi:beta-N-acetylhexosaminidase